MDWQFVFIIVSMAALAIWAMTRPGEGGHNARMFMFSLLGAAALFLLCVGLLALVEYLNT